MRRTYRGRSTGVAIVVQLGENIRKRSHRPTRRRATPRQRRWRDPALSNGIRQQSIRRRDGATGGWRHQFRNHTVAVRDEHDLAGRSSADIFAELILQFLDADDAHVSNVATWGYFFNSRKLR
jgi:hypothetical protein